MSRERSSRLSGEYTAETAAPIGELQRELAILAELLMEDEQPPAPRIRMLITDTEGVPITGTIRVTSAIVPHLHDAVRAAIANVRAGRPAEGLGGAADMRTYRARRRR